MKHMYNRESGHHLDKLSYGEIDGIHHPLFSQSYALFSRMFTWDGEPILDPAGYDRLFTFNKDPDFQNSYGPQKLMMTYALDSRHGQVVGGTDYTAMLVPPALAKDTGIDVLYFGAHIYIDEQQRGAGLALRLVEEREKAVRAYAGGILGRPAEGIRLLAVNEQNDPRKMTIPEIAEDIATTGVHPCQRIISSSRLAGWRVVDDRYRYREIDRDGDPGIDFMVLNVKGAGRNPPPAEISPALMIHFLERHAATRRYGQDPYLDPKFCQQVQELQSLQVLRPADISQQASDMRPGVDKALAALERDAAAAKAASQARKPLRRHPVAIFNTYGRDHSRYSPARQAPLSSSLRHGRN